MSKQIKDPILELAVLSEEIWAARKALNHFEDKREITKIEKCILKIEKIIPDLKKEVCVLREIRN